MKSLSEHEAASTYTKVILSIYAIIFLAAVYCLPVAYIGLPLLLFALLTVRASSSFPVKIAGAGNHLYLTDSFLLLSILMFDAEAATVLACLVTPCVLLHSSKSVGALICRSAISILPTLLAALLLRF